MNSQGIHLKRSPFDAAHIDKLIDRKNYDVAEKLLRKELKKNPTNHDALYYLGVTLWYKENHSGALVFLKRARANAKSKKQIHLSSLAICNIYDSQEQYDAAINIAENALKGDYDASKMTVKLINLYLKAKNWGKVDEISNALMPFKSSSFEILKVICLCLHAKGDLEAAIALALEEKDNLPEANILLTQFYNELGRFDETEPLLKAALMSKPGDSHLNSSLGNLLSYKGKPEEAKQLLESITESNNIDHLKWCLGTLYLREGDFETGHKLMESRYNDPLNKSKANLLPRINFNEGIPSTAKNILVSKEEGVGDQIRHAKYISMLPEEIRKGLYLNCDDRLIPLFKASFPSIKFTAFEEMNLSYMKENNVSHQILLASSYFLSNSQMRLASEGYFSAPDDGEIISAENKLKIGICWRSIKIQLDRGLWYMPLDQFASLFKDIDCNLVSLQNDVTDEERSIIKKYSGKDLVVTGVDAKDDFLGLGCLINKVDLVISTGTATSELSGALGKKTWVIANKHPVRWYLDQNYMNHFYPDMTMYLNTHAHDWTGLAESVSQDLQVYVNERAIKSNADRL